MSIVKVAELSGFSHATVSRVINDRPGVSPEAAKAVREAIREIGYTPPPNRPGRKPKSGRGVRVGNVAMIFMGARSPLARTPVTATVLHTVQLALADRGLNLVLGQVHPDGSLPPSVLNGAVDGLILHGEPPARDVRAKIEHLPSVWLMSPRRHASDWGDRVMPDNGAIGRLAAEYLLGKGHRSIAFVHGKPNHLGYRDRAEAFDEIATLGGAACHTLFDDEVEEPARDRAAVLLDAALRLDPLPTGLFVPRDLVTAHMYKALRQRGLEPGVDVEIVSCDNAAVLTMLDPEPASIEIFPERIGAKAVDVLLSRIGSPARHAREHHLISPRLVTPDQRELYARVGSPGAGI